MAQHPARCKACKSSVEALLTRLYGEVHPGWSSRWPCRVEDVRSLSSGPELEAIHALLVAHRGHAGFVRARRLPGCDFYVSADPGFLVEYDEEQHFTAPRALTLRMIPPGHALGFDRARWEARSVALNKRDNDPPFRDEQRAWYDLLRDVLPAAHGLGPTSRLLDREVAFCELDQKNAADLATFKKMLNRALPRRHDDTTAH